MNAPKGSWGNFPRFKIMDPCLIIIGKVSWADYINDDGDPRFNVVPDTPFPKYLTPANFAP